MRLKFVLLPLFSLSMAAPTGAQMPRPALTRDVPVDLVCGPQATLTPPTQTIRVTGGLERVKALFSTGDAVILNAGTAQGIRAGQHYYIRRLIVDRFAVRTTEKAPQSIHTAGWLTIVEVQEGMAIGKIVEACDGISEGDYLEPLVLPPPAGSVAAGEPDFNRPGRVILADERRQLGAGGGSLMIIDRGSDHGLRPGQRITLFRHAQAGSGPIVTIGAAFVATTQAETAVIRIEKSSEAIQVGDLVAVHR